MRGLVALAGASLFCWTLTGQTAAELGLSPEALLLARIKVKMEENLTRLPNYTCTQSIERSTRRAPSRRHRLVDVLRLEVALIDGKEYFAWPGSERFEEHELRKIVPTGAIGNGVFALHARSVFLTRWPLFHYVARETLNGRPCERFDYDVALPGSSYSLKVDGMEAVVPYHGSFWADAETLDLIRLDVQADDIPFHLRLQSAEQQIEYVRTEIGEGSFLLPDRAVTLLVDLDGNENRNETRFLGCHQYAGESFLTFDEPPAREPVPAPAQGPTAFELPAGLFLSLDLETPIGVQTSAVGDAITATVLSNAKRKGLVIVPKGAIVKGRLMRLEKIAGDYWQIAIRLESVEFGDQRASLSAELDEFSSFLLGGSRPLMSLNTRDARFHEKPAPGVGVIYVKDGVICLPRGTRMTWRTLQPAEDEK